MADTVDQVIIGAFELVSFPEFGEIGTVKAKIDTGAYTGAIHSTRIHEELLEDGTPILYFSPFDHPEVIVQSTDFSIRNVKSSNGHEEERYFIKTSINIKGVEYPITLSLADRTEMRWPVLIGRKFLAKNRFLVDSSQRSR